MAVVCLFPFRALGALLGWSAIGGPWRPFLVGTAIWGAVELSVLSWFTVRIFKVGQLGQILWLLVVFAAFGGHLIWAWSRPRLMAFRWPPALMRIPISLATLLSYLAGIWLMGVLWIGLGSLVLAGAEWRFERGHFPLTPPEPPKLVPAAEDALPLLSEAGAAFQSLSWTAAGAKQLNLDKARITSLLGAEMAGKQPELSALLMRYQSASALEHQALRRQHVYWAPWSFDIGHPTTPEELRVKLANDPFSKMMAQLFPARLLAGEGALALAQDRKPGALASVAELRHLAALVRESQDLAPQMISVMVENLALNLEGKMLAKGWQVPVAKVKPSLAEVTMGKIHWEMCGSQRESKKTSRSWIDGSLWKFSSPLSLMVTVPVYKFVMAENLRLSGLFLCELEKDPLPQPEKFDAILKSEGFENGLLFGIDGLPFMGTYWRSFYSASLEVDQRNLLVAVAGQCKAFRKKNGRWPVALWEAVPEASERRDYFSGASLKTLLRDGGGISIYSVGPDGMDDQGAPMKYKKGDLAFIVQAGP
jgi:hypothetical protein